MFVEIKTEWLLCPICGSKTRNIIREDTILINYPLYCPKCKRESLVSIKEFEITVLKEPDAQTQSRWTCEATRRSSALSFSINRVSPPNKKTELWWAVFPRPNKQNPSKPVLSLEGYFCVGLIPPRRCWLEAAAIYIPPYRNKDTLLKKSLFLYGPIVPSL